MQYQQLGRTDMHVSRLSLGGSSLGSVFREISEDEGIRTVHQAIDLGINFIDTSPYYGLTKAEQVLGRALRDIPRDRYYLASKCGRYGHEVADCDFSAPRLTRSVDESLQRLGVDYLDLIQVHDMEFGDIDQIVNETIPALQRVRQSGKARYVGITCLPLRLFTEVIERVGPDQVDTIQSYSHHTLNDTALLDILPTIQRRGVGVINAASLGMGLLTHQGPPPWHPAPDQVKRRCAQVAEHCRQRQVNVTKLAIQFSVREPAIATTLVGTADPDEIHQAVQWIDQPIDEQLLSEVQAILAPIHNMTWLDGRPENN